MRAIVPIIFTGIVLIVVAILVRILPASETGAVVTGIVALLGVFFSLEYGRQQFEVRLKEDRLLADEKRRFEAKQQAFIAASEALVRAIHFFNTITDRHDFVPGQKVQELEDVSLALQKLHFFADQETVETVIELSGTFTNSFIKIFRSKIPAIVAHGNLKAAENEILSYKTIIDRLEQQALALLGHDPNHTLLKLNRTHSSEIWKKISEVETRKGSLIQTKFEASEKCRDVVLDQLKTLNNEMIKFLLAVRRELNFPIDEARYSELIQQQFSVALASGGDVIRELRETVNQSFNPPPLQGSGEQPK